MRILGIETSCDETAAAVVTDDKEILSNKILSQQEHIEFGGVVPEVAARAHLDYVDEMVRGAMDEAGLEFSELDGVAVTGGPGLIGGVLVGVMTAKAISAAHDLPFMAVNHLEGHALTARLTNDVKFPYLLLLVSGGHSQILIVKDAGDYERLGTTIDDAVGEAFDKTAKLMGLGYPGGPAVEKFAIQCENIKKAVERFPLPRPLVKRKGCDFSFSGLKTAVRRHIDALPEGDVDPKDAADLCAAFQICVGDVMVDRMKNAIDSFKAKVKDDETYDLVVAGGVAANQYLRGRLLNLAEEAGMRFAAPPIELCSDNAVMIAWAGIERYKKNMIDNLDFAARPRWPLDPDAPPAIGAGVKA